MSEIKTTDGVPEDFDALLAQATAEEETAVDPGSPPPLPAPAGETDIQRQIREAREALAAPLPTFSDENAPEKEETAEERELKELQDQLARRNAQILEQAAPSYSAPAPEGDPNVIIIHVVEDGFTALGEVWHRGQEMEFVRGGLAYQRTKNQRGWSWVDLAGDLPGQYAKWGKQMIAPGPFVPRPGEVFDDEVAATDRRRGRSVPIAARR